MKKYAATRLVLIVMLACLSPISLSAIDTPSRVLTYDVVSIKPSDPHVEQMSMNEELDSFSAKNTTLKLLIESAYHLRADQVRGGPAWIDSTRFDVEAKITSRSPEDLSKITSPQRSAMLQQLLTEYFRVQSHKTTRSGPIYQLITAKNGPRIRSVSPEAAAHPLNGVSAGSMQVTSSLLTAHDVPLSTLTSFLADQLRSDVVDMTNLSGKYDLLMTWNAQGSDLDPDDTSLFVVIQEQLGLKLQKASGPVETLVIDHAAVPNPN